jgi:outer membrane protein assembly factor BamE (lipoprotein component of BamABCDE complex)
MRKGLFFVLAFLLLLQIGCTKSVRYTEEEIKSFPPTVQDNIRKGQLDLGMTQQQVRYAWGSPDSIKFLPPYDDKAREEWTYSTTATMGVISNKILLFFDGKLIYIK